VVRPDVKSCAGARDRPAGESESRRRGEAARRCRRTVVTAAAQWVGRLGAGSAVGELTRLLGRPETEVRVAAIVALQELRAAAAGRSLVPLLRDEDREVRVASARALGLLDFSRGAARARDGDRGQGDARRRPDGEARLLRGLRPPGRRRRGAAPRPHPQRQELARPRREHGDARLCGDGAGPHPAPERREGAAGCRLGQRPGGANGRDPRDEGESQ
jgi:hypothetical protein